MKSIKIIGLLTVIFCLAISCKKETLLDGSKSIERSNKIEKDLKTQLNDAKDGWILMLSSTNTDIKTAMPFILKFDTVLNKVTVNSIYGKNSESYFNVSASTGMPLLGFSSGSVFSGIYEIGGTDVSDYFFKVLKVGTDTLEIQSYRKGSTYKSEGGAILKLFKNNNPKWVTDWQQETTKLYTSTRFFGVYSFINLTFDTGEAFPQARMALVNQSSGNYAFFKASYPTTVNNSQVEPISWNYYPTTGAAVTPLGLAGYNSLFCEISTGFSPATLFSTGPAALQKLYKTNYFLIRKINTSSIDIFAVDKTGKEIITGSIKL